MAVDFATKSPILFALREQKVATERWTLGDRTKATKKSSFSREFVSDARKSAAGANRAFATAENQDRDRSVISAKSS